MNMLRRITPLRMFKRFSEDAGPTKIPTQPRLVLEQLSDRELLRVQGEEVVPFLQGLITNDMHHLQACPGSTLAMYAMFLNKAGRVLYDSIIYSTPEPNTYLIECDKHVAKELCRHLRLFRVRRKIEIEAADQEYRPWILFDPNGNTNDSIQQDLTTYSMFKTPDPRVRNLGVRIISPSDKTWSQVSNVLENLGEFSITSPTSDCNYRHLRYMFGIGEGVIDMPPGKCFPLEANCDFLHGVSFQKGCYLGQELTARVFHTGVIRKRLMPVRLTLPPNENLPKIQTDTGLVVGTVRGVCNNRALAVLRVEQVLNSASLSIDGKPCYVDKPNWWPTQLPSKASVREGS